MKKNLIIVGSNGDLGKGVSKVLLKKDYHKIYLVDRKKNSKKNSKNISIQIDDLADEKNVQNLFDQISFNKNELYFMYSTVGGFAGGNLLDDTEIEIFNKMVKLNIKISFLLAKYFISKTKNTKGGSICFTSAATSFNAEKGKGTYGLSKYALNYLIETLALENKENGISVNGIAPFVLDTKENREWIEKKSDLVSPENIGIFVHSLFENYKIISGNIIKLPGTIG